MGRWPIQANKNRQYLKEGSLLFWEDERPASLNIGVQTCSQKLLAVTVPPEWEPAVWWNASGLGGEETQKILVLGWHHWADQSNPL